ncbi:hypothetical protein MRP26_29375 [Bacillus sp. CCB-MMP212]|uniref:hypothetical protein n=1 Tax=Bacillus sp. CCB-MMP212 TaxID=2928002 RepID=UPI001F60F9B2|nr:hypothetical protein [Bacillus sp. CCB-MMP212]MCI4253002.1 hypothetical protein [Bacillus sp. CCB-MMP212]
MGTWKGIGQLIKGKDLVTKQEYGLLDYGWVTLPVVSGGTSRVVGKVVGVAPYRHQANILKYPLN